MSVTAVETGRCNARTRRGGACTQRAGWGTDHLGLGPCKLHGGTLPNVIEHWRREAALRELVVMGGSIEVSPLDALLHCVYRAAGVARWLRLRVEGLDLDAVLQDGQLNVWARLEAEALDRLARFSKMAIDAGVAERLVRIAERTGQQIAVALDEALGPIDLAPEQRTAIVARFVERLTVLEHEEAPAVIEAAA